MYPLRYIGIDTPESGTWLAQEATAKNYEMVYGKTVRIEKDISDVDKYGRLLRYVYVGDLFINAELVRLGYAQVFTVLPDKKYENLFQTLQQEAKQAKRGIWAPLTLQIVSVTSPVKPGDDATLVAKTAPDTECAITVYYKSGPSSAAGLSPKSSDANGNVSWTWKVSTSTSPGSWKIVVKANRGSESVSQTVYFIVQ